jgi:serine/threonine protein kinase/Tol biopolymer transport system component
MITHERWQRIKEIFYSAQDRPPAERQAFLNEVCGDDASVREEVEGLLTADAENENFLSSPAYEFAAGMLASEAAEFAAGERVGRYEILCSLGAGGMGQIYLARDAQLGRNIALKLIAQEFATDTRRVLRFEQEARAASALNHPNVCVIHEIGLTDRGRHFIAMEYIQGATLREHLARGPLKLPEALQITIQVGAALASAHAVGIVHRDVKPENIMLRPDGYVKVVDFGLAKLTEVLPEQQAAGEAQTIVRTEPRTLMGTVKYMSPEQLREGPVDERTDIWSLGVVLYEMLTGVTPFEARSRNDSVASILKAEPVQLTFPNEIPIQCQQIVRKALEKDSDERYQTITKLVSDLTTLKRKLERNADGELTYGVGLQAMPVYTPLGDYDGKLNPGSAIFMRLKSQAILTADSLLDEIRTHKTAAIFAGVSSLIFLLLVLPSAARWLNRLTTRNTAVQQATTAAPTRTIKALTNTGTSVCSAISSDGKWLVHAEEQKGKQHLLVTNTATSASTVAVPPDDVQYLGVTFSRDGNFLYFTRKEKNGPGILYRLAWPGTNPIRLKTGVDGPLSLSPNGDRFAFVRHNETTSEFALMVAHVDGSEERVLATRNNGDRLSIDGAAWSPDGTVVVCPASHWDKGFHTKLIAFDVNDGRERLIGQQSWFSIFQVAWQDDMSSLVVSARENETSPHQLWRIRFPDGTPQRITTDLEDYSGVSMSGVNIVTVRTNVSWRIWVANVGDPQSANAIAPGVGLKYGLTWTAGGKIVFSSLAQDRLNLFRVDPDGANRDQLTNEGDNYTPASSSDGRYIVFASNRNGAFNIWRINADDGSDPKQLTFSDGNFYPACSPDGQWVAYDNVVDSNVSVWKVPLNGGDPVKVGEKYRMPVFSPDNQFIACRYNLESGTRDVAIFPVAGGPPLRQFAIPIQEWQRLSWLANGRELSYVKNENGYSNIWTYNLDTGASKQVTNFNSDRIYAYAWSPDYKQIACQRGTSTSDVTMITER